MADELTPKQREALEIQQLVAAYQAVFGVSPKDRSTAQNMVWADIEAKGYLKKPTFVALARFNGDPIGAVDTVRGTLYVLLPIAFVFGIVFGIQPRVA